MTERKPQQLCVCEMCCVYTWHILYVYVCMLVSLQRAQWKSSVKNAYLSPAFNGGEFPEAADGMKCAAVKLEEKQGEDQIGFKAMQCSLIKPGP